MSSNDQSLRNAQHPRWASRPSASSPASNPQQALDFGVAFAHAACGRRCSNDVVLLRVPLYRTTLAQRGNSHLAGYGRVVAQFERTIGLLAVSHAIEEITHVSSRVVIITADHIRFAAN